MAEFSKWLKTKRLSWQKPASSESLKIKILLIRLSSIGDIVLTSPIVRMIKNQVEGAEIHFLTKKNFQFILLQNPYIDKVHAYDGNMQETLTQLKQESFDYLIDLHHNIRTARIRAALKVPSNTFHKLNWAKFLKVNFKIDLLPPVHIVDRYCEAASHFSLTNDQQGLDFFYPPEEAFPVSQLPEGFQAGFAVFVIGGQHATKRLPNEQIAAIIQELNYPVILLGGKDDVPNASVLEQELGSRIVNLCGQISLFASASLVKEAQFVISHDTGLMHIAAAFKKKIISIWGNTIPEFGMTPYLSDPDSFQSEVKNLSCRPCSKIGFDTCPKKHFKCMREQNIAQIITVARRWM